MQMNCCLSKTSSTTAPAAVFAALSNPAAGARSVPVFRLGSRRPTTLLDLLDESRRLQRLEEGAWRLLALSALGVLLISLLA